MIQNNGNSATHYLSNGNSQPDRSDDENDYSPSDDFHVKTVDILALLFSIISHIIDVAFDLNLAYRYYSDSKTTFFYLTLLFILFPSVVNTILSIKMYILDDNCSSFSRIITKRWIIRFVVLIFQLAPVLRYCESLSYALHSRRAEKRGDHANKKKYYELMLKEDSDAALLKVFECFLEAAPQQVLQVTIFLIDEEESTFQLISQAGSVGSSLLSMAWSIASYHRSIRFVQEDKDNISWPGTVMQFFWHFMVTVSRILSISVVASRFPIWTPAACAIHWIVMTFWLSLLDRTHFCSKSDEHIESVSNRALEFMFSSILGMVYIFTYIVPGEGRTRNRYIIYYTICFVENVSSGVVWAVESSEQLQSTWYYYPLLVSCIVPFLIGIIFMVLYYIYFHPKTFSKSASSLTHQHTPIALNDVASNTDDNDVS